MKKHQKIKITDFIIRLNPNAEWTKDDNGWIENPYLYLAYDDYCDQYYPLKDPRDAISFSLMQSAQGILETRVSKEKWPDAKILQRVTAIQD